MSKLMRRVRAAFRTGLTWGAAWLGAGLVMMLGALLLTGSTGADVPYPLGFGVLGFVAGVTFSGVLSLAEGRRRFDQMSLPRFTGWGAAGGFLFSTLFVVGVTLFEDPTFMSNLLVLGPVFSAAGAGCAGGMLVLARRAEDRGLLESGEYAVDAELTEGEVRELLGGD